MYKKALYLGLFLMGAAWVSPSSPQGAAWAQAYYVYVAAESEDEVALIRFEGQEAEVVKTIGVGKWPTEIEGPHGLTISPDGQHWYVSVAHGQPFGSVYKYETGTDKLVGEVEAGLFPATLHLSSATGLLYVVNFNLHGPPEPSDISVIDPETMTEVARTQTGIMPHGSRLSPDGRLHYSVAMMSGELVEMDALTFEVTRTLFVGLDPSEIPPPEEGEEVVPPPPPRPTWVLPHPTEPTLYVANNGSDEIVEVDSEAWAVRRRIKAGKGPYNLEITPDLRYLIATEKQGGSTGFFNLQRGEEVVRVINSRKVTHGVAVSPDSRYAFVSVEGVGGEPGTVDVIRLDTVELVASVDLGKQAGGIAFWKMTDAE